MIRPLCTRFTNTRTAWSRSARPTSGNRTSERIRAYHLLGCRGIADCSAGSGCNALTRDEDFTAGFIDRHPRQLLFGSDCPCRDGMGENFNGVCYNTRLQEFFRRIVTDEQVLRDIFAGNALRALEGTQP